MPKKVLVTGASGFVGPHLARAIQARGYQVVGLGLEMPGGSAAYSFMDNYIACDLTDIRTLSKVDVSDVQAVIHLAGLASQGASFAEPQKYLASNSSMFINLCEYLKSKGAKPRIVAVSSGAVYDSQQPMPLTEEATVSASSPYVVSKLTNELMAAYYRSIGLDLVVARPFNHTGPGQASGYILPDLVTEVRAAINDNKPVVVGNLQTKRDYTDVRDVCEAYVALGTADQLQHSLYNICSGQSVSGAALLELVIKTLAPSKNLQVTIDKTKIRPHDPPEIYGSFDRLHAETGWQPSISLQQTVQDFIAAST